MSVAYQHILRQGPVLASLARTAVLGAYKSFWPTEGESSAPVLPGPEFRRTVSPLPSSLIADYARTVGGNPRSYSKTVPPHLFPQWSFPLAARTLENIPYPLLRVVNGGCRLRVRSQLPADAPLEVSARLQDIEIMRNRAYLRQHVRTGPAERPDAVIADFYAIVPVPADSPASSTNGAAQQNGSSNGASVRAPSERKPRIPAHVPIGAKEIDVWKLSSTAGRDYAILTGDVNPIHWVGPYARAAGFDSVILHGFASMARTFESLVSGVFSGNVEALTELDVRFTRPLALPAEVGVYIDGPHVFVGKAPGAPAYLTGSFDNGDNK